MVGAPRREYLAREVAWKHAGEYNRLIVDVSSRLKWYWRLQNLFAPNLQSPQYAYFATLASLTGGLTIYDLWRKSRRRPALAS